MATLRQTQPVTPAPDAFKIHKARVTDDIELGYVREGIGGYPLLLVHGYPETKRIWWRNIVPLVEAGFEVIVPDLRGYGDSDLSPDDEYDFVFYSRDMYTLVHDVLGHQSCGLLGGDIGGFVICEMANRYPSFVDKMIYFNSIAPVVIGEAEWYSSRGLRRIILAEGPQSEYSIRQGRDWRELISDLDTPKRRRRWIRDFYEQRLLSSPGSFEEQDYQFMTEPFSDADRIVAAWAPYQLDYDRLISERPLLRQAVAVPTLILYGPDDHVVTPDFLKRCEIAFPNRVGPLVVPECGHFLQWERADILNAMAKLFFRAL